MSNSRRGLVWTTNDLETLARLWKANWSVAKIADCLGRSQQAIESKAHKMFGTASRHAQYSNRCKTWPASRIAQLCKWWRAGKSADASANYFKLSVTAVRKAAKRFLGEEFHTIQLSRKASTKQVRKDSIKEIDEEHMAWLKMVQAKTPAAKAAATAEWLLAQQREVSGG